MCALSLALSCAHGSGALHDSPGPIHDNNSESVASVTRRLQGQWLLVSFEPEVPLEGPMQGLLNQQLQNFVVEFSGATLVGRGPGLTMTSTFRIYDAYEDHFKATVTDSYGLQVDSSCDFSGSTLIIVGRTAPWRGKTLFRRAS